MLTKTNVIAIIFSLLIAIPLQASQFEDELLRLVNLEREKVGLSALSLSPKLGNAAQKHAEDMATNLYFSHTGQNGSSVSDRTKAVGYESGFVGENIAAGGSTPAETMNQWMNSQGHRENILRKEYQAIGFGYSFDNTSEYEHYWVQVFGNKAEKSSTQPTPVTKVNPSEKSAAIFEKLETLYAEYIYPQAKTKETRNYFLREYEDSPVSAVMIDKSVEKIWYFFNHDWHYFTTLDGANKSLCAGECF
jgi:hypothetical protein